MYDVERFDSVDPVDNAGDAGRDESSAAGSSFVDLRATPSRDRGHKRRGEDIDEKKRRGERLT